MDTTNNWKKDFIGTSEEAVRSGFQAVQLVTGTLAIPVKSAGQSFDGKAAKDQVQITLENAQVLRMDKGVPEPELKEDKFTIWVPYALPGQTPNKSSKFSQTLMKSAEALWEARGKKGLGWLDLVGAQVTLERREWTYTVSRAAPTDEAKAEDGDKAKKVTEKGKSDAYFFVENQGAEPDDVIGYLRKEIIVGKAKTTVLREFNMNPTAKRHPEFKMMFINEPAKFMETFNVTLNAEGTFVETT